MAVASKSAPKHQDFAIPEFSLPAISSTSDETFTLNASDLMGKMSVLFLYPKDDTSGCTQESKDFSALMPAFNAANVNVFGVSKDSVKKHAAFIKKYDLNVPLIADEDTKLIAALGAWQEKSLYGRKYMGTDRCTFVINRDGVVIMSWRKVKVSGHADAVFAFIKSLQG
jgi:peroxiredoxin Q/BCP